MKYCRLITKDGRKAFLERNDIRILAWTAWSYLRVSSVRVMCRIMTCLFCHYDIFFPRMLEDAITHKMWSANIWLEVKEIIETSQVQCMDKELASQWMMTCSLGLRKVNLQFALKPKQTFSQFVAGRCLVECWGRGKITKTSLNKNCQKSLHVIKGRQMNPTLIFS